MQVTVDRSICQGYGNCVAVAPEFFDLDDSGRAVVLNSTVEKSAEQGAVRAAIPLCPVNAIKLED